RSSWGVLRATLNWPLTNRDIDHRGRVALGLTLGLPIDARSMFVTTLEDVSALTRPNHPDDWTELDSSAVDNIRVLAADAVQKTGNGHPGTAMSLAPL